MILEKIDLKKIMTVLLSVRHCGRGAIAAKAEIREHG
jgi:hypothetical protein